MWDIDRSSWSDRMLFFSRTFVHMTGWSSLRAFKTQEPGKKMDRAYRYQAHYNNAPELT